MDTRNKRLAVVEAQDALTRETVGPDLWRKASEEIAGCIPPWAQAGMISMDAEAIRSLMVSSWLRGYAARREMMS